MRRRGIVGVALTMASLSLLGPPTQLAPGAGRNSVQYGVDSVPRRLIKIAGFGALSGPAHSFGINSRAALLAAADTINRQGGVQLAGGVTGVFDVSYMDDHCDAAQGISVVRQAANSDALVAVGPSCSAVAEALYQTLQHTVDDGSDTGIQMPVFTDSAMKANLTRISQWAFRNSPNETDMYTVLWAWVREHYPDLRTVYGGEEHDFAHSHSTWQNIIAPQAVAAGMTLVGQTSWSLTDRTFTSPVASMKAAGAQVIVISGHATTTCGVLRELSSQHVRPQLLVGLTSASTNETLHECSREAEGLLIPTSFATQNAAARKAAKAVERAGGIADLHSMAGWEIMLTLARLIGESGVVGTHDTLAVDRRKLRDALAHSVSMEGLLGPIGRSVDREARKPFVLVQARRGTWQVVYTRRLTPRNDQAN